MFSTRIEVVNVNGDKYIRINCNKLIALCQKKIADIDRVNTENTMQALAQAFNTYREFGPLKFRKYRELEDAIHDPQVQAARQGHGRKRAQLQAMVDYFSSFKYRENEDVFLLLEEYEVIR